MRNLSMKKFGTPMRAGPGVDSEKVGLAGVGEPSGFVARSAASLTLSRARPHARAQVAVGPVDGALVAGVDRRAAWSCRCRRPRCRRRPPPPPLSPPPCCVAGRADRASGTSTSGRSTSGTSTGGTVGSGVGRLDRAEVDDLLDRRGQTGDLHLLDRRAGRDVDRQREGLARHERHLHAVQRGGCGRDENHRVQGGSGGRDRQQLTARHPRAGSPPAAPAESRHPASAGRGTL